MTNTVKIIIFISFTACAVAVYLLGLTILEKSALNAEIKRGNFSGIREYNLAKEVGASTKGEYEIYLARKKGLLQGRMEAQRKYRREEAAKAAKAKVAAEVARIAAVEEEKMQKLLKEQAEGAAFEENKSNAAWLSDKYGIRASSACTKPVEALALYGFEWTNGWLESKFPKYITSTIEPYVLTISGDRIRFQNGFGSYTTVSYRCNYNVVSGNTFAWLE
jgi:hypothetical protein